MHTVELLAPAGSVEALHAAVRAGADAVYLGLESFNARRGASNFTLDSLRAACEYAHLRGVHIYVALNTAILPSEAGQALECARQAYRAGADAFIVQDIGLAAEIARTLPEARLHISTQMNTHNEAGVRAAAHLGAKRITLARELSLEEVARLSAAAAEYGMEVETFAHGALCICYSGQCFMSSMIGGRSANRGTCAQPCRLPYELRNRSQDRPLRAPGDHLLSPQDLCAVDLLPQLVAAGVSSLKIEGRMKSPEYVSAVVSVYRAVLDRVLADDANPAATETERRALQEAFSRGFTTAYLEGRRGNDIMSYQRPNNRGAFVGRVTDVRNGKATLAAEVALSAGDVLEFWTGKGHVAQTVESVETLKQKQVRVPLDARAKSVKAGDRVFRVRSAAAAYDDDALEPRVVVDGEAVLEIGKPLRVSFFSQDGAFEGSAQGPVVERARTKAVSAEDVRAHVDRLGSTPFRLGEFDVVLDEGVGIGFTQLHRVRAEALDDLAQNMLASTKNRRLSRVSDCDRATPVHPSGIRVAAWATNPACARAAKRTGAHLLYVPALNYRRGEAVIAGQLTSTAEQAGYPRQCIPVMPVVDHDPVEPAREAALSFDPWRYVEEGKPVLVESLGALWQAMEMGAEFEVGPHLPIVNSLSLQLVAQWGAKRV
ncbi:MAG: U32 family peptidase, partial [Eggerthellaceae bacterium]|nr:U32 family peptidase [Eggerthellaceae bacterium]